jgi:hypothetical protein
LSSRTTVLVVAACLWELALNLTERALEIGESARRLQVRVRLR